MVMISYLSFLFFYVKCKIMYDFIQQAIFVLKTDAIVIFVSYVSFDLSCL